MSTQQILSIPTTIPKTTVDLVFKGLEQTNELAYFRRVAGRHGFEVKARWASTFESLQQTLDDPAKQKTQANFSNLRLITLKIITSANHYYTIDYIKGGNLHLIPNVLSYSDFSTVFHKAFPSKLEADDGLPLTPGHFITSVEKMGDGIAVIYSYVILKKIAGQRKMASNQYPEQYFNTVFIPNDLSRVEYRVDKKLGKRLSEKAMSGLRSEFIDFITQLNLNLKLETVNFYKAIENIYNDKGYGRLVQVDFLDPNGDEDVVLRCRTDPNYDARFREVISKTANGTPKVLNLQVAGLAARIDSTVQKENLSNEIGFEPNKTDWSTNKFCSGFYFTQASDHQAHYGVINDILTRAI